MWRPKAWLRTTLPVPVFLNLLDAPLCVLSLGIVVPGSLRTGKTLGLYHGEEQGKEKRPMFKDFKAFIMRGNVLDLAVAVIIGAAFGAIVTSLVNDIIMPPIGLLLKGMDFKDLFVVLNGK